ncbi:MAG: DNA methyltransferase [bacterium]|nr:DNA methyltransferase [bacterium]
MKNDLKQIDFLSEDYITRLNNVGYVVEFADIDGVTYLNGTESPIHNWFRLTPSYSPELVNFFIDIFKCNSNTLVCDPFLGKGTTAIELKKRGIPYVGIEINPLLKEASECCLMWDISLSELCSNSILYLNKLRALILGHKKDSLELVVTKYNISIPSIYNVYRWWRKSVLKELLLAKYLFTKLEDKRFQKILWVILADVSLSCANIHRNHPTITFDDDNNNRVIDVFATIEVKLQTAYNDVEHIKKEYQNTSEGDIICGDSVFIDSYLHQKINTIITSPPYPNRFSYVHQTRPQLFFLDLFNNPIQSSDLDLQSIGGTWGVATSILERDHIMPNKGTERILKDIEQLRTRSNLMCNYALKYFNMLDTHIVNLKNVIVPGFRGAYVVGNSRLKGVEIYTDTILARLFELHDFTVDKIYILRKRGGRKELYETAICVSN